MQIYTVFPGKNFLYFPYIGNSAFTAGYTFRNF